MLLLSACVWLLLLPDHVYSRPNFIIFQVSVYTSNTTMSYAQPTPHEKFLHNKQPDDLPFLWDDAPPLDATSSRSRKPKFATVPTPNLDRLRNESVIFTRAYSSSPVHIGNQ